MASQISALALWSREPCTCIHHKTSSEIFIAVLVIRKLSGNYPNIHRHLNGLNVEWVTTLWCICVMYQRQKQTTTTHDGPNPTNHNKRKKSDSKEHVYMIQFISSSSTGRLNCGDRSHNGNLWWLLTGKRHRPDFWGASHTVFLDPSGYMAGWFSL